MMSKLLDYLNALDQDAAARDAHQQDPQAAMTQFGLSPDEQSALMSGDKTAISTMAGIALENFPLIQVDNINSSY